MVFFLCAMVLCRVEFDEAFGEPRWIAAVGDSVLEREEKEKQDGLERCLQIHFRLRGCRPRTRHAWRSEA